MFLIVRVLVPVLVLVRAIVRVLVSVNAVFRVIVRVLASSLVRVIVTGLVICGVSVIVRVRVFVCSGCCYCSCSY